MEKSTIHNEHEYFLAQWLDGTLSDEELKTLVGAEEFLAYQKLLRGTELLSSFEQIDTTNTFVNIQKKIQEKRVGEKGLKRTMRWVLPIAASFLLMFAGYKFFGSQDSTTSTSYAELKQFTLLDGSKVVLNAKSSLDYNADDWDSNRVVRLEGEAFFKVEKGNIFKVITENGIVAVLGTSFSVNSAKEYFEVICYEGRVKVTLSNDSIVLGPNMTVRSSNGKVNEGFVSLEKSPSWLDGESSFKSVPLIYVIDALERQYQLVFDTSKIDENMLFTGSFTHKNLEVALAAVFKTMRIHYSRENGNVLALSPYE